MWVNPLHRGGKIRPYVDTARPLVHELGFFGPAGPGERPRRLEPDRLRGHVDVRAWVGDPQSFRGWMTGRLAPLLTEHHPHELRVRVRRVADARTWRWSLFRSDAWFAWPLASAETPIPFDRHFAPPTLANVTIPLCLRRVARARREGRRPPSCTGQFRFRLFATGGQLYWNTRHFRNGAYRVRVTARDLAGNTAAAEARVTIAN